MQRGTIKSRQQRKHSVEFECEKLQYDFDPNTAPTFRDTSIPQINRDSADSPSSSLQVHDAPQSQQNATEEWAAILIQTAFRGFLVCNFSDHVLLSLIEDFLFYLFIIIIFLCVCRLDLYLLVGSREKEKGGLNSVFYL